MGSKDSTVTSQDLLDVGAEINKRGLAETGRRLRDMEPAIVEYIDAAADLVAGRLATAGVGIEHVRHVAAELRRLGYTTMRALWKDAFTSETPEKGSKSP